ncbi:uncharacterized protein tedc2 [Parambassis ranga]|uniref:Uncharacterized protein tedc2 n=1 Tax=Parambassis ranga TaxID=210632 RepID=A0A6P7IQJ4_9TELE|nr:uncharacterized protein LOC114439822 [Parambassis ranga]
MSLLSTIEEAIKSCKVEQARINDSIQLYRDLLQGLTLPPKAVSEESELTNDATADTSPGEKEEIELLERALEKALRVRTSTEPPKKDKNKLAAFHMEASPSDIPPLSGISKGSQLTIKSTSKSASLDRGSLRKPACSTLGSRPLKSYRPGQSTTTNKTITQNRPSSSVRVMHYKATSVSGFPDPVSASISKNKTSGSDVLSGNEQAKASSVSTSSSNNKQPHTDESGVCSMDQENGRPAEHGIKWKSLRSKQNRLWNKVLALQRKPVPGCSHFVERMRATFPKDWPCGSPDQTRALVHRMIHRGHGFTQHGQTREVLAEQTPEMAPELGDNGERLQLTAAEFQSFADQLKQEWKAWDRWRPEGGCLCPTATNGVCGREIIAPLPLTIVYTTEAELQEMEKLRTRVALLQQEIYLAQALLDTLSLQLSSIVPGPRCPNPSVLRDMYSLLGEGGERFPAIVLDSEPD